MQKATSQWEGAANVRFVHKASLDTTSSCVVGNSQIKFAVYYSPALGNGSYWSWAGAMAGSAGSNRTLTVGKVETFTDTYLLGTLLHELGHGLGFPHEQDTTSIANCDMTAQPGFRRLTCYDNGSVMHYPNAAWPTGMTANILRELDIQGAQSLYEAPTNVLNSSSGTVYARKLSTGDIYQRSTSGTWSKIGAAGQAFVTVGTALYGQAPGRGSPVKYNSTTKA